MPESTQRQASNPLRFVLLGVVLTEIEPNSAGRFIVYTNGVLCRNGQALRSCLESPSAGANVAGWIIDVVDPPSRVVQCVRVRHPVA